MLVREAERALHVHVALDGRLNLRQVDPAGDAPEEKLREVVERAQQRSAVFDMVTNGVPVTMDVAAE